MLYAMICFGGGNMVADRERALATAKPLSGRMRAVLTDPTSLRSWSLAAKNGIIGTAGILLGFAGAGASDRTLLIAATAATVAGMLSEGGGKWSETAAEREAQLFALAEEKEEIARQPSVEFAGVVAYYEEKGLSSDLALKVAAQLMISAPLTAQLESEHGILKLMSRGEVLWAGIGSAIAYALGAAIPFSMTFWLPVSVEIWVIALTVLLSLALISVVGARAGRTNVLHTLLRTLVVGMGTIVISYFVGEMAF
jgi:VIT1/CCC1 family predicted Fe2+/Mn2+ transporter